MLVDHALRIRRSIRSQICVGCDKRPAGSEKWSGLVHRPCELECTVFNNVQRLAQIVEIAEGDPRADLVAAIRDGVCPDCHSCTQPLEQRFYQCNCPLKLNHQKVTGLIEAIVMPVCGCD
jgi:hypothetical protein